MLIGLNLNPLSSSSMVFATLPTLGLPPMVMKLQHLSLPTKAMTSGLETIEAVLTVESIPVSIQMDTRVRGRSSGTFHSLKWVSTISRLK